MDKKKIVVFDFDKTITYIDTNTPFFVFSSKKVFFFYFRFFFYYLLKLLTKIKLISNLKLKNIGLKLFIGKIDKNKFNQLCVEFSKTIKLKKQIIEIINSYISSKYEVIISTASLESYVIPLFSKDVKVYGSTVVFNKGVPKIGFHSYGENKIELLKNNNIIKIDVLYTDSFSDFCLAKITKNIKIVDNENIIKVDDINDFIKYFKKRGLCFKISKKK